MLIICDVYSLCFISCRETIIIRSCPNDLVRALEENQITRDASWAEEPLSVVEATDTNATSEWKTDTGDFSTNKPDDEEGFCIDKRQ